MLSFAREVRSASSCDDGTVKPDDVIVIGPGAIGCAFAAALCEVGHSVVMAGRTRFERLVVQHPQGEVSSDAIFVGSAAELRPAPFVILATKAYQVPAAADFLRASCGPGTILAVLQNGIGHEARVRPFLNASAPGEPDVEVLAAMVACPADRTAPGQVAVGGRALLEVESTVAGRRFADAFEGSFAVVRTVEDMHTSLWRKLIMNAVGGGIGVLTGRSNAIFASDPEAVELARSLALEVVEVARADGANLGPETVDTLLSMFTLGSTHLPSIVVDRINTQPTEWEIRNHVVVEKGLEHGVATPLMKMLTTLIRLGEP